MAGFEPATPSSPARCATKTSVLSWAHPAVVSRLSSPTTRASAAAPRRRGSVDRNVNANRIYRGQLFRFLWRTTSLNQHYFAFLTTKFSRIHCWVGPNRSGPCDDPIGPFREASGFAAVGGGHLAALDSLPSACGQQKGSRRGHRRPQVLVCVGNPAESIPAAEMACLSGISGNLEIFLRRLSEAVINKRPRQAGASGAAAEEDGPSSAGNIKAMTQLIACVCEPDHNACGRRR
jgi:hypothetical protein